jgi:hypothetical protein
MSVQGHSLPRRIGSMSGHVRCGAESGSNLALCAGTHVLDDFYDKSIPAQCVTVVLRLKMLEAGSTLCPQLDIHTGTIRITLFG